MTQRRTRSIAICLLLTLWAILVVGNRGVSLSMDEPYHIARGYTYLARGRAGFWYFSQANNPPLLNAAQGALVYLANPNIPLEKLDGWGYDFKAFSAAMMPYLLPAERTEVLARLPIWLLTFTLAAVVLRWTTDLGERYAGLLALFLFAFDPLILANGRLATADLGVTALGTAALYCAWRWYRNGQWRSALSTGVLIGLTLLTKYSSILYAATVGMIGLATLVLQAVSNSRKLPHPEKATNNQGTRTVGKSLAQLASAGLLALGVVWTGFLFFAGELGTLPIHVPAPMFWDAVLGLRNTPSTRITVLFGEVLYGSRWWYFPLNFLIKNPLPLIVTFLGSVVSLMRRRSDAVGAWHLALFPSFYIILAVLQGMNVSYRHMLPVHPYIHIITGLGLARCFDSKAIVALELGRMPRTACRLGAALAALWYVWGTLAIAPDELAYFNELVGGPEGAPRVLVDYTQDWGQYFKALVNYLNENPGDKPEIFVFTPARPDHYGIDYDQMEDVARFHPQPGRYVLGPGPIYGLVGEGQRRYDWFRHETATEFIAHALYIYDIQKPVEWLAQCTTPLPPLDEEAIDEGFAAQALRQVEFDCTQSWLYPAQPAKTSSLGTYALHDALLNRDHCGSLSLSSCVPIATDTFTDRHISQMRLAYEQRQYERLPAFALYEHENDFIALLPPEARAYPAPIGTTPNTLSPGVTGVEHPQMGSSLIFEGIQVYQDDSATVVETWWRAVGGNTNRLYSVFAHLITSDGLALGGDDGLGVSPLALAPGDTVVQQHTLPSVVNPSGLWIRTGVYWLDDQNKRWPVAEHRGADALFIPLEGRLPTADARDTPRY